MPKAFYISVISLLVGSVAFAACEIVMPSTAPAQPPIAAPAAIVASRQEQPTSKNVPWRSQAEPRLAAVISGKPVSMTFGQPCVKFRTLPQLEFRRDTLIKDACLEIPNDTTITVQSRTNLGIIATNGFKLGRNVRIIAKGTQGMRGERSDFESVTFTPKSDVEINATCVNDGNRCTCPGDDSNARAIRGHAGANGSGGGFLHLVLGALVSPSQLAGLGIDVNGGRGGPPGESGSRNCRRGNIQCSSNTCSEGTSNGSQGVDGSVYVALGGAKPDEFLRMLGAATMPLDKVTAIPIPSVAAMQAEIATLDDRAYLNDWDRRSGQDPN
jgi:hypothetical protein